MRRLLAALLLSALPATVLAGSTLEAEVANATWQRTVNGTLQQVAAVRVIEIQTTFAHRSMPELSAWNWGEVIAVNSGYADPIAQAVIQWLNSPPHWAVLTGGYTAIGCAQAYNGRYWFVCLFGIPPAGGGVPPPPAPPITGELPNAAALDNLGLERDFMLLAIGSILAVMGFFSATEWALHEKFMDLNPEIRRKFDHFRRNPPPDPHVCPRHHLKVKAEQRCWMKGCDWRSPP
jgi:hypothetical protein